MSTIEYGEVECEARDGRELAAYLRGLAVDSIGGQPVTAEGRKAVVLQLRAYGPGLSIRQVAKLVGADEKQARRWLGTPPNQSPG